jgi:hypothetical protein
VSKVLRLSIATWLSWIAVVLLASLPGCQCGSTGVETRRFSCSQDNDCVDGFVCRLGECVTPETPGADGGVDSGIPDGGETDGGSDGGLPDAGGADAGPDGGTPDGAPTVVAFLIGDQTLPAGGCSNPVELELRDAYGNAAAFSSTTAAALTSQPAPGLLLFADSGCTTPLSDAQFAAGSSRTSFFFKGRTGGTFTLSSAPGGLPPASLGVTILPVVRSGNCRINDGSYSVTCTISPAQLDPSKTMLFFQATSSQDNPESASTRCELTDASTLTCTRSGNAGVDRIQWQTAELASGLRVQHLQATCGASDVTSLPIQPVTDTQTFLLVSSEQPGADQGSDDFYTAALAAPDRVDLRFSDICQDAWVASVQVVELTGAAVTRGETAPMTGTQLTVSNLPAVDPASTALLFTYRMTGGPAGICDRVLRGELTSSTSITFSRGAGDTDCTDAVIDAIAWERIDFGARARATHVLVTMNGGTTTSISIPAVDPTRTLVFASGQAQSGQGGGESAYSADDVIGASVARHILTSPTSVDLSRGGSLGAARWTSTVLELEP